jgi:hypothetical protein
VWRVDPRSNQKFREIRLPCPAHGALAKVVHGIRQVHDDAVGPRARMTSIASSGLGLTSTYGRCAGTNRKSPARVFTNSPKPSAKLPGVLSLMVARDPQACE